MSARPPRVLAIAGSDSSGGAGLEADLATFAAHGVFGLAAVTAVTAQSRGAVTVVAPIDPAVVAAQIDAAFADGDVGAVKVGMLANAAIVDAVADRLAAHAGPPVVLDPVLTSGGGAPLLDAAGVDRLRERLLPLAALVTPNLPEAERLAGRAAPTLAARRELLAALARLCRAVLLKGGHGAGDEVVDLFWDGTTVREFARPRLTERAVHGTGCVLSSAIAARLAAGETLRAAVAGGIDFVAAAIAAAIPSAGGGATANPLALGVPRVESL